MTTPFHVHLSFLAARPAHFRTSTRGQVTDFVVGLPQFHNYIGSYQHNKFLFYHSQCVLKYKEYNNGLFENNNLYSNSQNKQRESMHEKDFRERYKVG